MAERGQLAPPSVATVPAMTLAEVLVKYRDEITSTKRCADNESYAISSFLRTCSNLQPLWKRDNIAKGGA